MKLLALLLCLVGSLTASQKHRWLLNGNGNDSIGSINLGALGSPVYVTQLPVPIEGANAVRGLTDSVYLSSTANVCAAGIGSISLKTFFRPADGLTGVVISENQAAGNFFILINTDGSMVVRVPVGGSFFQSAASATGIMKKSKWQKILATFSGSTVLVKVRDMADSTYTTAINADAGGTITFGTATDFRIGRDTILGGFSCPGTVDDVIIDDSATPTEETGLNPIYEVATFGHSYVRGTDGVGGSCGAVTSADGYRWNFQNEANSLAYNFLNVGQTLQGGGRGTVITPLTDGHEGDKAVDMLALIHTKVPLDFPNDSSSHVIVLGPIEYNDCAAATNLTTYQGQILSAIKTCVVDAPSAKIIILSGPITGVSGCDITNYVTQNFNAYQTATTLGYNVAYRSLTTVGGTICSDNIHPNVTPYTGEYDIGGAYIADQISSVLTPTATPAPSTNTGGPGQTREKTRAFYENATPVRSAMLRAQ